MRKIKYLVIFLFICVMLFLVPNISNATDVTVNRTIYSNNGSMKFEFKGLNIDTNHDYEYGLTKTNVEEVVTWHLITDKTATSVVADVITTTKDLREVIDVTDTGYITIKDKTRDTIVLKSQPVDLKIPFLQLTNYTVVPNGIEWSYGGSGKVEVALRNDTISRAYFQYEKITDINVVNKYKEIKSKNGDVLQLQNILKKDIPKSNWSSWDYWDAVSMFDKYSNGIGYPTKKVNVSDSGLYYLWVYFSGENIKNIYGYILVDNLQPDIALESVSLPKTAQVELGKTLTLTPTFNPTNATNKIVIWTSSDETVATVDNAGKITPKKLGSTIITVTSQDGNKKATCTITVTEASKNGQGTSGGSTNNGSSASQDGKKDATTANGVLPQTGVGIALTLTIAITICGIIFIYTKYYKLKDI